MTRTARTLLFGPLALFIATAHPGFAQSQDELTALSKELQAVRAGQESMRRELQEIKSLLQGLRRPTQARPREVVLNIGDAPFRGDADATVTLVEFSDYQCPFCSRHVRETAPLLEEYIRSGRVKYVFRDFPIETLHKQAFKAHEAARCAGDQNKYWEMNARLFANQTALDPPALVRHAEVLGLDIPTFRQCVDSGKHIATIRQAIADGQAAGVTGTPTFVLGLTDPDSETVKAVTIVVGAQPFARFEAAINRLLDERQ